MRSRKGASATLFILESNVNRKELTRTCLISALISLFCFVFYLVYNHFSHGVHSPYMTFLFAWPLVLLTIPSLACLMLWSVPGPSVLSSLFWKTGTAAVTVSSLLRGIFDIAGNSSVYQVILMAAGLFFLVVGFILYLFAVFVAPGINQI